MDYNAQIETIRDTAYAVKVGNVTLLTGKNGAGKSLVRKLLGSCIAKITGGDPSHSVASVSMESRTQQKHQFAALKSLGIDDPTNPTSGETLKNIRALVNNACKEDNPRYLVIDEPEIGMGEEMVMALAKELEKIFVPLPPGCLGVMIITHNRYLVKHLGGDFLNLEGMTREEWLNREIVPTDLEKFESESLGLYRAILNYAKP